MYQALTFYHSIVRWMFLISIVYATFRAYKGYKSNAVFSKADNNLKHWTATIAHIQLVLGVILYSQSPITKFFWRSFKQASHHVDIIFFGIIHVVLMLTAIILVTIGSALVKRRQTDKEKFKTMLYWFSISVAIVFIAIPWPFSPLASRPYFR